MRSLFPSQLPVGQQPFECGVQWLAEEHRQDSARFNKNTKENSLGIICQLASSSRQPATARQRSKCVPGPVCRCMHLQIAILVASHSIHSWLGSTGIALLMRLKRRAAAPPFNPSKPSSHEQPHACPDRPPAVVPVQLWGQHRADQEQQLAAVGGVLHVPSFSAASLMGQLPVPALPTSYWSCMANLRALASFMTRLQSEMQLQHSRQHAICFQDVTLACVKDSLPTIICSCEALCLWHQSLTKADKPHSLGVGTDPGPAAVH